MFPIIDRPASPMRRPAVLFLAAVLVSALLSGCGERHAETYLPHLRSADRVERMDASVALVQLGSAAVEPLIAYAQDGPDTLRYIAAQILGQIGDRRATPFLVELLGDSNLYIRDRAVRALGQMADPTQIPVLTRQLATDVEPEVREGAAWALGNLRDTTAVDALVAALADSATIVRRGALSSLQYLWTERSEAASIAALQDQDEEVAFVAAQLLGFHRVSDAVTPLCAALQDSSLGVRVESARALGLIGDSTAVRPLERLFSQREGPDHEAARQALRQLTGLEYAIAP